MGGTGHYLSAVSNNLAQTLQWFHLSAARLLVSGRETHGSRVSWRMCNGNFFICCSWRVWQAILLTTC